MKVTVDSQELANLERELHDLKMRISVIRECFTLEGSPIDRLVAIHDAVYKALPPETLDISTCRDDLG